jgi:hypothetical protein
MLVVAVLLALAIVGVTMFWSREQTRLDDGAVRTSAAQLPATTAITPENDAAPAATSEATPNEPAPPAANAASSDQSSQDEYSEDPAKMFKADAAGNLVVQERTRLNVEKLSALYTPAERQQRLATIEQTLPASAYRQLTDLLERYENFSRASRQTFPPGQAPTTVEEAVEQHEGLHALRVAHFGAEATEAMYGKEEAIGRRLLDFMALEKHEGLTMEEKAMKAQEMLMRSPELAEAYEKNRNTPANPN